MTKVCSKCKARKPLAAFARLASAVDGLQPRCKTCDAEYRAQNKDKLADDNATYYAKNKEHHQKRRQANKRWLNDLKLGRGCDKCGYAKCARSLEYHHRDPQTKLFSISNRVNRGSRERLLEEIAKCDLLCRNCHGEVEEAKITFIHE